MEIRSNIEKNKKILSIMALIAATLALLVVIVIAIGKKNPDMREKINDLSKQNVSQSEGESSPEQAQKTIDTINNAIKMQQNEEQSLSE